MARIKQIPERIKILRQLKNWSRKDLADASGVNHCTIFNCEVKKAEMRTDGLEKVTKALGVGMAEMFCSVEDFTRITNDMVVERLSR